MYDFALVALMALAVVKVVDVLTDNVEALQRFRSLLTIAFGVGIVLWLDYSIFEGWDIAIDDRDTGPLAHGLHGRRHDRPLAGGVRLPHP